MHHCYDEYGHGFFQADYPSQVARSPQESDRFEKVKDFDLLFKKPGYSGPSSSFNSRRYDAYSSLSAPQDS
jgi:hypothetical protein